MACEELHKLRDNVRQLQARMKELRTKSTSTHNRRDDRRHAHGSSLEYLKRRIARAAAEIEHHVATHGCHEAN